MLSTLRVVDEGAPIIRCKRKDEVHILLEDPLELIDHGGDFVKGALLPAKFYHTQGLIAPKNGLLNTLDLMYKSKVQRCDLDEEGNYVYRDFKVNDRYGNDAGVVYNGFAELGARKAMNIFNLSHVKAEKGFMKRLRENAFDTFSRGNMTYSCERGKNCTSAEAFVEYEEFLELNDCSATGDDIWSLAEATLKTYTLEVVLVRKRHEDGTSTPYQISKDAYRKRTLTHNTNNKTMERGTSVSRSIACISPQYKVICKVMEAMAIEYLEQYPNQVMTVGGIVKDQKMRDILFDERIMYNEFVLSGAEDKTGWNRQIMSKILHEVFRVWTEDMSPHVTNLLLECWKISAVTYVTIDPVTLYDEVNKRKRNFHLHNVPWEKLPDTYKKKFHNREDVFKIFCAEVLADFTADPLRPIKDVGDMMIMGIFGGSSSCMRTVGEALFIFFRVRYLCEEMGIEEDTPEYEDVVRAVAAMVSSSDDSMTNFAAVSREMNLNMQKLQATIDLLLCMQLSGKKTNYTMTKSTLQSFSEFTTKYAIGNKLYVPSSKGYSKTKLGGAPMAEEVRKLTRAAVEHLEEGTLHGALYAGVEAIRLLSSVCSFKITNPNDNNPYVALLKHDGTFGQSPLHGYVPPIDPISGLADPFYLQAVKMGVSPLVAIATSVGVADPVDDIIGLKYRETEDINTESFSTIYGAPKPFTMTFIETNKPYMKYRKGRKRKFMDAETALCTMHPEFAINKHNTEAPKRIIELSCKKLGEMGLPEPLNKKLKILEGICSGDIISETFNGENPEDLWDELVDDDNF